MRVKPRVLFVRCLHPVNLPILFLASFIFRVIYWRTEGIKFHWLLKRFEVIDPAEYFTFDEYSSLSKKIYDSWKADVQNWSPKIFPEWKVSGLKIDWRSCLFQWMAIDFEAQSFFVNLIEHWGKKNISEKRCYMAGSYSIYWLHHTKIEPLPPPGVPTISFFFWLDLGWQYALCLMRIAYQLFFHLLTLKKFATVRGKNYRFLWMGISPVEMADGPGKIDFSFLCQRGLISPQDCLYILPIKPTGATLAWLSKNKIHWATNSSIYSWLTFRQKIVAILSLITTTIKGFSPRKNWMFAPILFEFTLKIQPWLLLAQVLRVEVQLNSISQCWPESPIVAAMNALGIRTVNWAYGANTFGYSSTDSSFEDLNVMRSVSVAREVWVWNKTVAEWLHGRSILSVTPEPDIRLIGPVMSGDARFVQKTPSEVRQVYGIPERDGAKFIAVFDVPPVNKKIRLQIGHGPTQYPLEMLEQFFEDLCMVLEKFPETNLIIKPKRSLQDSKREYAKGMYRFVDPDGIYRKQKRVFLLEYDIDPYVPVAMADLCVGLPFTSPVVVGLNNGRHGIYHDPLGSVRYFRPKEMQAAVTHGQEELLSRIGECLRGDQMISNMAIYREPAGDPAIRFAEFLDQQNHPHVA